MLPESIPEVFRRYLSPVDGIVGLYVSDKDGARMAGVPTEDINGEAFMNYAVTTFISSIQLLPKLGLGQVNQMITRYDDRIVCQFNYMGDPSLPPVYLTVVGTVDCDIGLMTSLEPLLRPVLGVLARKASARFESEAMMIRSDNGEHFYRIPKSTNLANQ